MPATPRERPIAVFDSGVGGLTVLHELLVALPGEDFLYLGDTARFPYGDESHERAAQRSRWRSPSTCSRRREAARRRLRLGDRGGAAAAAASGCADAGVDVLGVIAPAAELGGRGDAQRPHRPAGDAGDRRERRVRARRSRRADPHVELESVACPDLAPIIQSGFPFDERVVETVRRYTAPLREAERRHRDPRLDALPARRADAAADARARRAARQLRRGRRARGRARARRARAAERAHGARARTASTAPATSRRSARSGRASCRCRSARSSRSC